MPNKMERFTQRARRVLSLAQESAEALKHNYIGTEHLLLGLMREEGGVAGHVLRALGVEQTQIESLVLELSKPPAENMNVAMDLTPSTKRVLELTVDEARRMGHQFIGTEHMLLGMVRQSDGVAIEILKRLNISPEEVRRQTRRVLLELAAQSDVPTGESGAAVPPVESSSDSTLQAELAQMGRFTQRARRVVSLAQEAAQELENNAIDNGHLLMGLMREEGGVAGRVLRDLGADMAQMEAVLKELSPVQPNPSGFPAALSPTAKQALELGVDEARRMGHHYIGTEHMLLGLVRQSEGVAIEILKRLNITPESIRRQTRRVLQESPVQPSVPSSVPPPATEPESDVFRVLKSAVDKILEMVEHGDLTIIQARQLFAALRPNMLSQDEKRRLELSAARFEQIKGRWLRVIVTDKSSGDVQFDMKMPLSGLFPALDFLVQAVTNQQLGSIFRDSSDPKNDMEIRIEED